MTQAFRRADPTALLFALLAGCSANTRAPNPDAAGPAESAAPSAAAGGTSATSGATGDGSGTMAHHDHMMGDMPTITIPDGALITEADVRFMQGMIAHHAQAVHMTRMADASGASDRVLKLAQKIDLSQAGEIVLMQEWLGEYRQVVPDTSSWRTMNMPGMLTADDLEQLEAARGVEFDRLFLTFMIRHHEGALSMVADLMASPRAAQEVDISVFANDVEVTQMAEIGLMRLMLAELP